MEKKLLNYNYSKEDSSGQLCKYCRIAICLAKINLRKKCRRKNSGNVVRLVPYVQ